MQPKLLKAWVISIIQNFLMVLKICDVCNKNCFKRAIKKTAEATGHLIGNNIADEIPKYFKIPEGTLFTKCFKRIAFKNRWEWNRNTKRKIYISSEKGQQIIDELRLE